MAFQPSAKKKNTKNMFSLIKSAKDIEKQFRKSFFFWNNTWKKRESEYSLEEKKKKKKTSSQNLHSIGNQEEKVFWGTDEVDGTKKIAG